MANKKKAIIRTLLYSSLFNFPLTKEELYYYLQTNVDISYSEIIESVKDLSTVVVNKGHYYTIKGYEKSFEMRQKRLRSSQSKISQAKKVAQLLGKIPFILFIGISGSVAVNNAAEDDDIDLFILTKKNSLYTSRFLSLFLLQIIGKRRKRIDLHPKDKICLNMLADEEGMNFAKESHNLYLAREIAQIYPLFERDDYYKKLLYANKWIKSFLPHALGHTGENIQKSESFLQNLPLVETIFRCIQIFIINRNLTREVIDKHLLAFHPEDTKNRVLKDFAKIDLHYSKYYK